MSPLGYENRIQRVCLADIGNTAHTLKDTHEDKDTLLQKPVKKHYVVHRRERDSHMNAGLNIR